MVPTNTVGENCFEPKKSKIEKDHFEQALRDWTIIYRGKPGKSSESLQVGKHEKDNRTLIFWELSNIEDIFFQIPLGWLGKQS